MNISVRVVYGDEATDWTTAIVIYFRQIFLCETSSPTLQPSQPFIRWVPGPVHLPKVSRDVKLAIDLHLISRVRIYGVISPLPLCACMTCAWGNLILSIPCMEITMEQILFELKNLY